jgi:hypothetical protein
LSLFLSGILSRGAQLPAQSTRDGLDIAVHCLRHGPQRRGRIETLRDEAAYLGDWVSIVDRRPARTAQRGRRGLLSAARSSLPCRRRGSARGCPIDDKSAARQQPRLKLGLARKGNADHQSATDLKAESVGGSGHRLAGAGGRRIDARLTRDRRTIDLSYVSGFGRFIWSKRDVSYPGEPRVGGRSGGSHIRFVHGQEHSKIKQKADFCGRTVDFGLISIIQMREK